MSYISFKIEFDVPGDEAFWVERIERGAIELEQRTGSAALCINGHSDSQTRVPNRVTFLKQCLKKKWRDFFLTNGVSGALGSVGFQDHRYLAIGGSMIELSPPVCNVSTSMHLDSIDLALDVIETVGDAMDCLAAYIIPQSVEIALIAHEVGEKGNDYQRGRAAHIVAGLASLGIPHPLSFRFDASASRDVRQPRHLGWINYWSKQTCEYLGFPNAAGDEALLQHSSMTPAGAWIVRLTEEMLDLHRLDHLKIFAAVSTRIASAGALSAPEQELGEEIYPCRAMLLKIEDCDAVIGGIVQQAQRAGYELVPELIDNQVGITLDIVAAAYGWIQLRSSDPGYFASDDVDKALPRFAALCEVLGCEGLSVTAYSEAEITVLHADGMGRWEITGFVNPVSPDALPAYERSLVDDPSPPDLSAVDIDIMDTNGGGHAVAEVLQLVSPAPGTEVVTSLVLRPQHG